MFKICLTLATVVSIICNHKITTGTVYAYSHSLWFWAHHNPITASSWSPSVNIPFFFFFFFAVLHTCIFDDGVKIYLLVFPEAISIHQNSCLIGVSINLIWP